MARSGARRLRGVRPVGEREGTAVDNGSCPYQGLRPGQGKYGFAQVTKGSLALGATGEHGTAQSRKGDASVMFDRVMNWVVGTLLTAGVTAVVFIQAHPPR